MGRQDLHAGTSARSTITRALALAALVVTAALALALPPALGGSADLAGRTIVVDAGHGGSDPGASGFGLLEKDVNLDVAKRLAALLDAEGATVVMTRDCDCTVSLSERSGLANRVGADRFVSIHANACGGCGGHGTETYYHSGLSSGSTAAKLAGVVQDELVDHLGLRDRGVKTANFHVLRETHMPAVLAELGFIDHAGDNAKLASATARQEAARGLLHAIQRHYGIAPHDPATPAPFSVTIEAPAHGAWLAGTVTADGAASGGAGLVWLRFLVDGTVTKWVTPAPHEWAWDTTAWADGARTLTLEGRDDAGTVARASVRVHVDNAPPTVTLTRPADGGPVVVVGGMDVEADAADARSGVARVEFRVDGALRAVDATAPYAWAWPAGEEAAGRHVLTARAVDRAGNAAEDARVVDASVPTTPTGVARTVDGVLP